MVEHLESLNVSVETKNIKVLPTLAFFWHWNRCVPPVS